jgi:hypothetical protein
LFEAYSGDRLTRDLSAQVLEHLPELESSRENVEDLNWRAKHPGYFHGRMRQIVPAAAAVLLVVLGALIRGNWPTPQALADQQGIVAYARGDVTRIDELLKEDDTNVGADVFRADRYTTLKGSNLMLTLDGATHVKMGENSRIKIDDARTITIEQGQVYLDVGKTDRVFRASTPTGNISVFGTRFGVTVLDDLTMVAVEEGQVQIDHKEYEAFATLRPGQIVNCRRGDGVLELRDGDVTSLTRWAKSIMPDSDMLTLLKERYPRAGVSDSDEANRFLYREFLLKDLNNRHLDSIVFSWEPDAEDAADHCGYNVYVYTDALEPIFMGRVNGSVFSNPRSARFELLNDSLKTKTSGSGWVRLVPVLTDGLRQNETITVDGRTGTNDELN